MISCRILEQPGRWRLFGIVAGLLLALAPAAALLGSLGFSLSAPDDWFGSGFGPSVIRTVIVATVVGVAAMAIVVVCRAAF